MDELKRQECGECRACCTTLGVVQIGKPPGVRCEHVGPGGCGIYATRPTSCSGYECLWIVGAVPGPVANRPDHLGVIFEHHRAPLIGPMVVARECREGGLMGSRARYLIGKVSKRIGVCEFRDGKVVGHSGPREFLRRVEEVLARSRGQVPGLR